METQQPEQPTFISTAKSCGMTVIKIAALVACFCGMTGWSITHWNTISLKLLALCTNTLILITLGNHFWAAMILASLGFSVAMWGICVTSESPGTPYKKRLFIVTVMGFVVFGVEYGAMFVTYATWDALNYYQMTAHAVMTLLMMMTITAGLAIISIQQN